MYTYTRMLTTGDICISTYVFYSLSLSNIPSRGGQAKFANPQTLGIIPLSQICKFRRRVTIRKFLWIISKSSNFYKIMHNCIFHVIYLKILTTPPKQMGGTLLGGEGEEICRRMPRNFFSSSQFLRKRKSLVFFQSINFLCKNPFITQYTQKCHGRHPRNPCKVSLAS